MSMPEFEPFLERAPIIQGGPSFDHFVRKSAERGFIDDVNASRYRLLGRQLLTDQTVEILEEIEQKGEAEFELARTIVPLLRTAHDFSIGDVCYVGVPVENATLMLDFVASIEDGMSEDEIFETEQNNDENHPSNPRGLILFKNTGFGLYAVRPQWPALIPEKLMDAINSRQELDAKNRVAVAGYANYYFQTCFFDPLYATSPDFENSARRTPRNLRLITYTKPHTDTN